MRYVFVVLAALVLSATAQASNLRHGTWYVHKKAIHAELVGQICCPTYTFFHFTWGGKVATKDLMAKCAKPRLKIGGAEPAWWAPKNKHLAVVHVLMCGKTLPHSYLLKDN